MDNNIDKRFDELFEATLAGYSNAEPRAGLEGRILARLDEQRSAALQKTWFRFWPALSLAAAAVIALVVFLAMPRSKPTDQPLVKQAPPEAIPTKPQAPPQIARVLAPPHVRPLIRHSRLDREIKQKSSTASPTQTASVKEDVFPAASPLTDQEKMLFAYLRRTPAVEVVTRAQPDDIPDVFQPPNRVQLSKPSDSNLGK